MGAKIDVLDGQVIDPGRKAKAEQRAKRIVSHLDSAAEEIAQAVLDEDWTAMGLSPDEWRERVLGGLAVEARRQVHELLSGEGLSTRRIAAATGTPRETVRRDLTHCGSPCADQGGRNETGENVTRPKTGAQRAAEHRARKREQEAAPEPPKPVSVTVASPPEPTTSAVTTPRIPDPGPRPCSGCRSLEAKLEAAREEIQRLRAARPDAVLTAERDFQADPVRVLEARLSEALMAAEQEDPGSEPPAAGGPCVKCGQPGTPFLYDGEPTGKFACDRCLRRGGELVSRPAA